MGAVWNQRCGRRTDLVFELTTEQRTVGFRAALPKPSSKLMVASVAVARSAKEGSRPPPLQWSCTRPCAEANGVVALM
jgi:hypothetical protein